MNSSSLSLARLIATASLIVLGGSFRLSATTTSSAPIPDVAASEVARAFDRLTAQNDQRVAAAIDSSITAIGAEADTTATLVAVRPAARSPGLRLGHDFRRNRAYRVRG